MFHVASRSRGPILADRLPGLVAPMGRSYVGQENEKGAEAPFDRIECVGGFSVGRR